jgi:hypothetical protein
MKLMKLKVTYAHVVLECSPWHIVFNNKKWASECRYASLSIQLKE